VIWKIAWGGLVRHGRRSVLIVLAIAISVATMEFVVGMMSGMRDDFFETMVSSGGHLRLEHVDAADALDPTSLELLIPDWSRYVEWFRRQPEVVRVEAVLTFGALLVNGDVNAPMIGYGIDPETGFLSDVRGGIEEGRFLSADAVSVADTRDAGTTTTAGPGIPPTTTKSGQSRTVRDSLKSVSVSNAKRTGSAGTGIRDTDDPVPAPVSVPVAVSAPVAAPAPTREIIISTETATLLDLSLGDPAMVLVEDSTGAPYYLDYEIVGIFRSDSGEFDESSFLVSHAAAQELLYVGDETREIRVVLTDETLAEAVAQRFRDEPGGADGAQDGAPQNASSSGSSAPDAEIAVRTWRELQGGMVMLLEMFDVFMYAINLLIVIVAATVITNAILMNVFEKMQEYGTMRAVGLTSRGVVGLVIAEGAVYGIAGSVLGLAIGVPLVLYFETHGIDFGEAMESFGLGREIYTAFRPGASAVNAAFGALTAIAGSIYAALVSRRRTIIESIRGIA